jgi:hypothetical protein
VGHFNADLRRFEQVVDSRVVAVIARGFYYVLPNLATFDVKARVVHAQPVGAEEVLLAVAYGFVYVAMLLVAAASIFSRRDFK